MPKGVYIRSQGQLDNLRKFGFRMGIKNSHWRGGKSRHSLGYILIYVPDHPHKIMRGYVLEHRLVMEKSLGRYLRPQEVVHHINKNHRDNRIENLMLFKNNSAHLDTHRAHKL